jgi:hypothetical protein
MEQLQERAHGPAERSGSLLSRLQRVGDCPLELHQRRHRRVKVKRRGVARDALDRRVRPPGERGVPRPRVAARR